MYLNIESAVTLFLLVFVLPSKTQYNPYYRFTFDRYYSSNLNLNSNTFTPSNHLQYPPSTNTDHVSLYQPGSSTNQPLVGNYIIGQFRYNEKNNSQVDDYHFKSVRPNASTTIYKIHHYYQSLDKIPLSSKLTLADTQSCKSDDFNKLCVPNTDSMCLTNGTIMCATKMSLTTPCDNKLGLPCVYSKIPCSNTTLCKSIGVENYSEFYLPCIMNLTIVNRLYLYNGDFQLCITAVAQPEIEIPLDAIKARLNSNSGNFASTNHQSVVLWIINCIVFIAFSMRMV